MTRLKNSHCTVENCENAAFYKEAGLCQACYQGLYYWQAKRTPTQAMQRKRQLGVLASRMDVITPRRGKGK
jgi:hypothetical protein